jgi:hypothetical protein
MDHKVSFKTKVRSNAVATHSDTKRNIPRESLFLLLFCVALIPLTHQLNRVELRDNKPLVLYGWLENAR